MTTAGVPPGVGPVVSPGSRVWSRGDPRHFVGECWTSEWSAPESVDGVRLLGVQFSPGARTYWHSHSEGQVLHVIEGAGIVANEAGDSYHLRPGDTVTTPAGQLHWHGALSGSPLLHMSITTGGGASWTDRPVTEQEYASSEVALEGPRV